MIFFIIQGNDEKLTLQLRFLSDNVDNGDKRSVPCCSQRKKGIDI